MTGTHIICDQDPQKVVRESLDFKNSRFGINVEIIYSTTPVMVGVTPTGQANVIVFTSALILWECTDEEFKSYLFKQNTLLKK